MSEVQVEQKTYQMPPNVQPSLGFNPPRPTRPDPFAADALYEIKIDTNDDNVAGIAYSVRFSPS